MKHWFEGLNVALIGNATYMFEREYGKEIESHDVVVRLNKAAMLFTEMDREKSHGKRTDIWMFWNAAEYKNNFRKTNAKLMHMGHQGRSAVNRSLVDFVYPDEYYAPLKRVAGKHHNPTTGFMALDYISKCNPRSVTVYGFDWKETPTFTDPDRKKEKQCPHDFPTEKKYCFDTYFTKDNFILRS